MQKWYPTKCKIFSQRFKLLLFRIKLIWKRLHNKGTRLLTKMNNDQNDDQDKRIFNVIV